ncbi:MAG TPA: hypothetical protein EYQ81_10110, partial [Sneathiellales bacterium]|nr:hypothetical protein [Sneathiellales bacterium]
MRQAKDLKYLGMGICTTKLANRQITFKRMRRAKEAVGRIAWSKIPMRAKIRMIRSIVIPIATYGAQMRTIARNEAAPVNAEIDKMVWGKFRRHRCPEILRTMVLSPSDEPSLASIGCAIKAARRLIKKRPERRRQI